MRKCTLGFVLFFAIPLLAKPFVISRAHKAISKPEIFRDSEIEEIAKSKEWTSWTASPGDIIGSSQYDRQWNLSPLRRIVFDPVRGNVHVTWMHQVPPPERHMFYNFYNGTSWGFGTGVNGGSAVQTEKRDGYGAMDLTSDGRVVVALHRGNPPSSPFVSCVCVDFDVGAGGFDCYDLPGAPAGENTTIWPRVAVDASDNMVVVAHTDSVIGQPSSVPCPRHYSRSTDGGANWSAWAPIDTFIGLSTNIFASKISDKFCITWGTDSLENGLYNGHIVYKISTDGGADWGNVIDIMGLIPLPSGKVYGFENMRNAVGNTYGIYDSQDNIHIVTDASIGSPEGPGYYYPYMSSVLWHYSSATGEMNLIATHPFPHGMAVGKTYPYYGQWMAKPVIGEDPTTKNLYAAWIEFPYDIASDTVNKYEIGEIYCSYSLDGGATWAPKLNLTMTPENCEVFLSMAPIVNEKLRFFYMYDKNNHDDIIGGALDPDTCLFLYFEAPITPGDIEVVSIEGIPDDSFNLGDTYYPIAVYTNKGTTPVSFQARFEMTNPSFTAFESGDTIVAPSIFYYDIINVDNLGAGVTDSVEFKPWVADTPIIDYGIYCNAFGTLLIDAELSDNQKRKDVGIEEEVVESPALFALSQSYPNPLGRGTASIRYEVPRDAQVSIKVYDIAGKLVATLVDRSHKAGTYTTNWNRKDSTGKEVPTGVYFYRLSTDKFATTKKLLLVR